MFASRDVVHTLDSSAMFRRNYEDGVAVPVASSTILAHSNTPRITADGRVMFFNSTEHAGRAWAKRKLGGEEYDSDIYYSLRTVLSDGTVDWGEPVNLGPSINTSDDDAIETISPSGSSIYFSSLAPGWVRSGGPFYTAELAPFGAQWRNIHGLGGGITEFFLTADRFKIYGSAVTADGDAFYFATTAHSHTGEHELWVSRQRDGEWGYPENLGGGVNAEGGSFAPFIAADGKTLYFSSGRKGGYGGDDVYMTALKDSIWQMPQNLGPGVNSAGNESFLAIPASGDQVYLSRSEAGSRTSTFITARLDPRFLPEGIVLVTGTVVDHKTCETVQATVTIEDLETSATMHRTVGTGINNRFVVVLHPGRDYGISVSAPGYGFYSMRYQIPTETKFREVRNEIELDRIVRGTTYTLNNIFFDYDSDTLRLESCPELDRLIALMVQYPSMRIQIGGHTDNIGSAAYNDDLSRRRAESVRRYVIEQGGMEPERIRAKGYGARRPSANNADDQGRQKNRVVDFNIVNM